MHHENVVELSIIVPIYKIEEFLKQCIESILNQSFSNFELILVNDGSPDNCPKICEDYAKKDKRIIVVHKKNGGLVSARKAGLEVAKGKYVGFVDGDDWIDKEMYQSMMEEAYKNDTDIVICNFYYSYKDIEVKCIQGIESGYYNNEKLLDIRDRIICTSDYYQWGLVPAVWNKIVKRELIYECEKNVDNNIRLGEDAACTYPCILKSKSLSVLEGSYFYHYRQNPKSMAHAYDLEYFDRVLIFYNCFDNVMKEYHKELEEQIYSYYSFVLVGVLKNEAKSQKQLFEIAKRYKEILNIDKVKEIITHLNLEKMPLKYKVIFSLFQRENKILFSMVMRLWVNFETYKNK